MSAYICWPEHFGILATCAVEYSCVIPEWRYSVEYSDAEYVARGLASENIRSVIHRYPNDRDGHRPGPQLLDVDIVKAAGISALHFLFNPKQISPVQVIKLVNCLEYQSCETPDWTQTLAYKQLQWIRSHAISRLPGYEEAVWEFVHPIPELDELYERQAA